MKTENKYLLHYIILFCLTTFVLYNIKLMIHTNEKNDCDHVVQNNYKE